MPAVVPLVHVDIAQLEEAMLMLERKDFSLEEEKWVERYLLRVNQWVRGEGMKGERVNIYKGGLDWENK